MFCNFIRYIYDSCCKGQLGRVIQKEYAGEVDFILIDVVEESELYH